MTSVSALIMAELIDARDRRIAAASVAVQFIKEIARSRSMPTRYAVRSDLRPAIGLREILGIGSKRGTLYLLLANAT